MAKFTGEDLKRRQAFSKMYLGLIGVHAIIFLISYLAQSSAMQWYSVISSLVYVWLVFAATRIKNIKICFNACWLEIMAYSFVGTIFGGSRSGFSMYLLGVIPVIFFLVYSYDANPKRAYVATMIEIVEFVLLTVVGVITDYTTTMSPKWVHIFYIFNSLLMVVVIVGFFAFLFISFRHNERQLVNENDMLRDEVNTDTLTGLLTRRSFEGYFTERIEEYNNNKPFSVVMCDIDHFKAVNDTYGHDVGDIVLKEISGILKSSVRESDHVFRWGGEEFLILLATSADHAKDIMERCRLVIEQNVINHEGTDIKVTISIGICEYQKSEKDYDVVLHADKALYESKNNGRNRTTVI